jgi:hypothetical protein
VMRTATIKKEVSMNKNMVLCILPEVLMRGAAELNCERSEHLPSVARQKKIGRCRTGAKDDASPNPKCVLGTLGSRIRIFPELKHTNQTYKSLHRNSNHNIDNLKE